MSKAKKLTARADTETTGMTVYQGGRPFAVSMRFKGETLYWEWVVDPHTRKPYVKAKDRREINLITRDRKVTKVFFNCQFDIPMLEAIGCQVRGPVEELYFKVRACYSFLLSYELKTLCRQFLDIPASDQDALQRAVVKARRVGRKLGWKVATKELGFGSKPVMADYWMPNTLWKLEPEKAAAAGIPKGVCGRYAKLDAIRTEKLDELFSYGMDQTPGSWDVYEFETRKLLPIVMGMQTHGVPVDEDRMKQAEAQCQAQLDADMALLNESWAGGEGLVKKSGGDFNPDSAAQVGKLLFDKLGIPVLSRTKKGQAKTGGEFLMPFVDVPEVRAILSARANRKALSAFFGNYRKMAEKLYFVKVGKERWLDADGNKVDTVTRAKAWKKKLDADEVAQVHPGASVQRLLVLHPGLNQWGTGTARFTCKQPNLQQVSDPTNTDSRTAEFVVDIRQVFIPRPGCVWYAPDYKQVEVIVFADLAQVKTMLDAIRQGVDIHKATADRVWGGFDNPNLTNTAGLLTSLLDLPAMRKWDGKTKADDDETEEDLALRREIFGLVLADKGKVSLKMLKRLLALYGGSIASLEKAFWLKVFRKRAKATTFLKIFGGGIPAMMAWTGLPRKEAASVFHDYDRTFPEIVSGSQRIIGRAAKDGYITNAYGRRIQVDRQAAYKAVNYVVQSSAAELMKRGMVKCHQYLEDSGLDAKMVLTVHDELIFEFAKRDCFKGALRRIRDLMADHGGVFSVPTPVDMAKVTERWSQKVEVKL